MIFKERSKFLFKFHFFNRVHENLILQKISLRNIFIAVVDDIWKISVVFINVLPLIWLKQYRIFHQNSITRFSLEFSFLFFLPFFFFSKKFDFNPLDRSFYTGSRVHVKALNWRHQWYRHFAAFYSTRYDIFCTYV